MTTTTTMEDTTTIPQEADPTPGPPDNEARWEEIREDVRKCEELFRDWAYHALRGGQNLIELKAETPHGAWLHELDRHGISQPTAWRLMKYAKKYVALPEHDREPFLKLSMHAALDYGESKSGRERTEVSVGPQEPSPSPNYSNVNSSQIESEPEPAPAEPAVKDIEIPQEEEKEEGGSEIEEIQIAEIQIGEIPADELLAIAHDMVDTGEIGLAAPHPKYGADRWLDILRVIADGVRAVVDKHLADELLQGPEQE